MLSLPKLGPDLLRHFGYPTTLDELKENSFTERAKQEKTDLSGLFLSLPLRDARKLYMELMESNPNLFLNGGPNCILCTKQIILPIDLRKRAGLPYHGVCFTEALETELKTGKFATGLKDLEYFLRADRVCSPNYAREAEPLNKVMLEWEDVRTREKLESFYF